MSLNPELQRQLNLECSQSLFLGISTALGILFAFTYMIDGYRLGGFTGQAAFTVYLFIAMLWGGRKTYASIIDEFRDRTWDIQRLSALEPWTMTWGKLLGSTVMVWFAGTLCLLIYSLAAKQSVALSTVWGYSIAAGLLLQSGSLLLGLLAVLRGKTKSDAMFIAAIIVIMWLLPRLLDVTSPHPNTAIGFWYDIAMTEDNRFLMSLTAALFWCLVGCYRLMAQALGLRSLPWVWLSFIVFASVFAGGFLPSALHSFPLVLLLVGIALTYTGVLAETSEAMRIKHFARYVSNRRWRRAGEEVPIWWLSFTATLIAAIWLSFTDHPLSLFGATFHFYPIAIALILLRDCALYLYFCYGPKPQRAFSMALLTAAFLYGILPGLFSGLGLTQLAALAFPLWADSEGNALACAAAQSAIMLKLLYQRWKSKT